MLAKLKLLAGVLVALLLLETASVWWQYNRASIVLTNRAGHDISDVKVDLDGASQTVGSVADKQTVELPVSPKGKSGYTLSFKTPDGRTVTAPGYIESRGGYQLHLTVNPDYSVKAATRLVRGLILLPIIRRARLLVKRA